MRYVLGNFGFLLFVVRVMCCILEKIGLMFWYFYSGWFIIFKYYGKDYMYIVFGYNV